MVDGRTLVDEAVKNFSRIRVVMIGQVLVPRHVTFMIEAGAIKSDFTYFALRYQYEFGVAVRPRILTKISLC